jgi:hypothetical protein
VRPADVDDWRQLALHSLHISRHLRLVSKHLRLGAHLLTRCRHSFAGGAGRFGSCGRSLLPGGGGLPFDGLETSHESPVMRVGGSFTFRRKNGADGFHIRSSAWACDQNATLV